MLRVAFIGGRLSTVPFIVKRPDNFPKLAFLLHVRHIVQGQIGQSLLLEKYKTNANFEKTLIEPIVKINYWTNQPQKVILSKYTYIWVESTTGQVRLNRRRVLSMSTIFNDQDESIAIV